LRGEAEANPEIPRYARNRLRNPLTKRLNVSSAPKNAHGVNKMDFLRKGQFAYESQIAGTIVASQQISYHMFRDRYKEACKRRGSQGARRGLDGDGSNPERGVEFSCVLPTEAPMSILALRLIAIIRGFAKTIKVTFP